MGNERPQYPGDHDNDDNARAIPTVPGPRREGTTGGGRPPASWRTPPQRGTN